VRRLELRRRLRLFRHLSKRDLVRGRRVLRLEGAVLEVPAERVWAYSDGTYWEKDVLPWLQRAATAIERPVFYDIGANCGHYTVALAPAVRAVFAFEPIQATYAVLARNIARNRLTNVTPLRIALGDSNGETTFFVYSSSGRSSAIPEASAPERRERVQVATLDRLLEQGKLEPPDLIKIDTEGSELSVLRGAAGILSAFSPILMLEFHPEKAREAGYGFEDLGHELERYSYSVFTLSDLSGGRSPSRDLDPTGSGPNQVGNVLALPPGRSL
jgi:FkbM family methyltransferase